MKWKELGEVRFEINNLLDWKLNQDESLRQALIDNAASRSDIPPEYRDWWTGEVNLDPVDGTMLLVTISVDEDVVPKEEAKE